MPGLAGERHVPAAADSGALWERWSRARDAGHTARGRATRARRGGLGLELDDGTPGYARRQDLPLAWRRRDPGALVGLDVEGLVTRVDPKGRGVFVSPRDLALLRCRRLAGSRRGASGAVVRSGLGGVVVEVEGIAGTVAHAERRHLSEARPGAPWRGYVVEAMSYRLVLSEYGPLRRRLRAWRRRLLVRRLRPGARVRGVVAALGPHGVQVALGSTGAESFVPREQLSWWRVVPEDAVAVGEPVRASVLSVPDAAYAAVELSLRALMPNPWERLAASLPRGSAVRCRVSAVGDEGAIVALLDHPPAEALLPRAPRGEAPDDRPPQLGDELWALVDRVNVARGRLYLGRRIDPPDL